MKQILPDTIKIRTESDRYKQIESDRHEKSKPYMTILSQKNIKKLSPIDKNRLNHTDMNHTDINHRDMNKIIQIEKVN